MTLSRFVTLAAFAIGLGLLNQQAVQADTFTVDGVHSTTVFRIHHMNAGYTYGLIGGPTGSFDYDANDPTKVSFQVSVSLDHLDTQSKQRDADLKGPDWFNAKQFPTISFKSTAVKKTGDNAYDVTGDLTLHGVTKSITVPMTMTGAADAMGKSRCGFETMFTINRSDYDMKGMVGPVGDEVRIIVALEGTK